MHDLKTFECSNSSQKVWILLKKLGEIRKSSSYRKKLIQGTDKFVRLTEVFEFSSIRVIGIFLAWKGLAVSRDQQICLTLRDVRVSEYLSYRESTVSCKLKFSGKFFCFFNKTDNCFFRHYRYLLKVSLLQLLFSRVIEWREPPFLQNFVIVVGPSQG